MRASLEAEWCRFPSVRQGGHGMKLHANSALGPKGRLTMVRRVVEQHWSLARGESALIHVHRESACYAAFSNSIAGPAIDGTGPITSRRRRLGSANPHKAPSNASPDETP